MDNIELIEVTPPPSIPDIIAVTQGVVAVPGPVGPQGPIGPAGADGVPGPAGADGLPGTDGQPGPQGPIGPKGDKGDAGAAGADGRDGLSGVDGAPGPVGPQGDTGPIGPTGRDGRDGLPGRDGIDGSQGPEGPAGPQGIQGEAGISYKGISLFCSGKLLADEIIGAGIAPYDFTPDMNLSAAYAVGAATATTTFTIRVDGAEVGTITFPANGLAGTIAFTGTIGLGSNVIVRAPSSPDATLSDITVLLRA